MKQKRCAFIFPGQGAQYPGMGKDFFEKFSAARETYLEADNLLGYEFSKLIFEGPKEELTLTKNSQLAIFITSVALWRTFSEQHPELKPVVCAGLSLGEYTALVASERISFEECLFLVKSRAEFMNEACEKTEGTMRVVLGLPADAVESGIRDIEGAWVANINCPGQVVISGTPKGVEKASEKMKELGAKRVLPLDVSGAFHSGLMRNAQTRLEPKVLSVDFLESDIALVQNVSGCFVKSSEQMRRNLIDQVSGTVRWEEDVRAIEAHGVDLFVEIGPGKTLSGMNKKIGVETPTKNIETVEDLEGALC